MVLLNGDRGFDPLGRGNAAMWMLNLRLRDAGFHVEAAGSGVRLLCNAIGGIVPEKDTYHAFLR